MQSSLNLHPCCGDPQAVRMIITTEALRRRGLSPMLGSLAQVSCTGKMSLIMFFILDIKKHRLKVKGWKKIFHANGRKESWGSNTYVRQNSL